jgi:hypothetical protein
MRRISHNVEFHASGPKRLPLEYWEEREQGAPGAAAIYFLTFLNRPFLVHRF